MQTALITGSAKRLGSEMARHLAAQGVGVAVHYHQSQKEAEALVQEIEAKGGKAAAIKADLGNRHEVISLIEQAAQAIGAPLDILINNASSFEFDRIDDEAADFKRWDRNFSTNLEAPYFLTQAFARQCPREGVVINMIDQRVLRLTPNYGSYTLAKSALWTMTRTAAMALAPKIRVNAIGPGTTLKGEHQSQENFEHHRKISILERGADIEDILDALDYLIRAKTVTGQMICPDGGQHLIWELPK